MSTTNELTFLLLSTIFLSISASQLAFPQHALMSSSSSSSSSSSPPSAAILEFTVEPTNVQTTLKESFQLDCSAVLLDSANQHSHNRHQHNSHNFSSKLKSPEIRWRKDGVRLVAEKINARRVFSLNGSLSVRKPELEDEGLYQCEVHVITGAYNFSIISRYAKVQFIDEEIKFLRQPEDVQVSIGETAMFACITEHSYNDGVVQWYHDNVPIRPELSGPEVLRKMSHSWFDSTSFINSSAGNSRHRFHSNGVLEISPVLVSDVGNYKCSVNEMKFSRIASLSLERDKSQQQWSAPQLTFPPTDLTVVKDQPFVLNCAARGKDRHGRLPHVIWLKDGVTIDFEKEENVDHLYMVGQYSLYVDYAREDDSGLYTCRATNAEDSIDAHFILNVLAPARIFDFHSESMLAVMETTDMELPCIAEGNDRPIVTWFKNAEKLTPNEFISIDPDDDTLSIFGVSPSDQGMYQCIAMNSVGGVRRSIKLDVVKKLEAVPRPPAISTDITTIPSPPLHISVSELSPRSLRLSWKPSKNYLTSLVTGYIIISTDKHTLRERRVNASSDENEITLTNLIPKRNYNLKIIPFNERTFGYESAAITVETPSEVSVPSQPTNIRCSSLSSTSIHLSWHSSRTTQNEPMITYKIFYRNLGEEFSAFTKFSSYQFYLRNDYDDDVITDESDLIDPMYSISSEVSSTVNTEFTFNHFLPHHEYAFKLVATNDNGPSPSAREVTCKTYSDVPSQAPQNVTLETVSSSGLILRWESPARNFQNGVITGYKIKWKKKGDKTGESVTVDGARRMYELSDLSKGSEYNVRLQALTVNGSGPSSPLVSAETFLQDLDESVVPGQPTSLKVRPMSNSIGVSWAAPVDASIVVRGYLLSYGIGIPDVYKLVLDARQRFHSIKGLKPMTEYVITLKAFNNVGEGVPVLATTFTKDDSLVPEQTPVPLTPPVGLKASTISSTTIRLSWTDPNEQLTNKQRTQDKDYKKRQNKHGLNNYRNANGKHVHYVVRAIARTGISNKKFRFINSTDSTLLVADLRPSTEYEFNVKVVAGKQESAWSLSTFNQTKEAGPSSAPRDLSVFLIDGKQNLIELTWQPPKQTNGEITGYLVYHTDDVSTPDKEWSIDSTGGDSTSLTMKNLPPKTTRYFKMQARNAAGYSPLSATVAFRVPEGSAKNVDISESTKSVAEPTGLPTPVFYVVVGSLAVLFIIASILIASVVCYKRKLTKDAESNNGTLHHPTLPHKELKPPDLWNHEQGDSRSSANNRSSINCSPTNQLLRGHQLAATTTSSVISNEDSMSLDMPEEDRYLRPAMNFMYSLDHNCGREGLSPLLSTTTTVVPAAASANHGNYLQRQLDSSLLNNSSILGCLNNRPFYSKTSFNPNSTGSSYVTVATTTPRVNAGDIAPPPPEHSLTTLERQKQRNESARQLTSTNSQRNALRPVQLQNRLPPLTSQHSPSSPPLSNKQGLTSTSPTSATTAASATGCDVTEQQIVRTEKSISTEELTAEMANLEGLMKDLNAITQSEFNC